MDQAVLYPCEKDLPATKLPAFDLAEESEMNLPEVDLSVVVSAETAFVSTL